MSEYLRLWLALRCDHRAITALEYALIAGIIVVTIVIGFGILTTDLSNKFSAVGGSL
jgi:Flp pilus assembly pilin Flp